MVPHDLARSATPTPSIRIHRPLRVHLVGLAGSGMRSLADVLASAGWHVCGSDFQIDPALVSRYNVRAAHSADAIDESLDLVVHSDAVPPSNPELVRARSIGVPCRSYPEIVAELMQSRAGVAVAGTHGKSTTAAMVTEILLAEGLDPTTIVGATTADGRGGGRLGASRWLVAEACEYRANFLKLAPQMAAVLNVEHDHFDCFATPEDVEAAFTRFAARVPREGLIVHSAECPRTRRALAEVKCHRETFGIKPEATWQAREIRERRGYYSFQIRARQRLVCDVALAVPGRHNVHNALAAAALASHCGATGRSIRAALERFAGLERRLEVILDGPDLTVVDDYAHHPTEVSATLATIRQMHPGRRVWCVFEPHQSTRLARLLDEFAASLDNADKVVVTETFRARESPAERPAVTADELVRRIVERGGDVVLLTTMAAIRHHFQRHRQPSDVLVTVGAGEIGTFAHGFKQDGARQSTPAVRQAG